MSPWSLGRGQDHAFIWDVNRCPSIGAQATASPTQTCAFDVTSRPVGGKPCYQAMPISHGNSDCDTYFSPVNRLQIHDRGLLAFNANCMQAARPAAQYQPTSRIEDSVRQSEDPQFSQRRLVSRRILDIAFFPAASHNKFVHSHDLHDRYGLLFVGNDGAFLPPGLIISTTKNFILIILDLIEWRWFGPFIPEESVAYVPSYVVSGV